MATRTRAESLVGAWRYRRSFILIESLVAAGAVVGALQLATGTATPPVSDLKPLGLTSWTLPAVWLFASVAMPSSVAAWMAWRRARSTPNVVLFASAALGIELIVQMPFVGPSWFQLIFGALAIAMASRALRARQSQTWLDQDSSAER